MKYGCIGEHLPHSFSKEIHGEIADYAYKLQELTPDELPAFLAAFVRREKLRPEDIAALRRMIDTYGEEQP